MEDDDPKLVCKRPTMRDVATLAGVSHTSVSMALRSHPSIPPKTRERILEAAKKLGYTPDPMLSSLAVYRQQISQPRYKASIAWITNHDTKDGWRKMVQQEGYYEGARERAEKYGYALEEFWLKLSGLNPNRASQILLSRGIRGLIFAPQPHPNQCVSLYWKHFAAITLGYTISSPRLHLVMNQQYGNMRLLLCKLYELGYRKIGLAMPEEMEARTDHHYLGAYLVTREYSESFDRIPLFLPSNFDETAFIKWVRESGVEIVVTNADYGYTLIDWMKRANIRVPQDVAVALPSIPYGDKVLSGIEENVRMVGANATDLVISMINSSEYGIPEYPKRVLTEGIWRKGKTVKKLSPVRR